VKHLLAVVSVAAVALLAAHLSVAGPKAAGQVASLYDGDTLTLSNSQRIRLLQIDTPELGSGECYSRAARTELLSLAPSGSRVGLESDARLDERDRYGKASSLCLAQGQEPQHRARQTRSSNALLLPRRPREVRGHADGCSKPCQSEQAGSVEGLSRHEARSLWACDDQPEWPADPPASGKCDPSYRGVCIPPPPPDLDCDEIPFSDFSVVGSDPHGFDGNGDGVGCES
jgi:micrococcal nuclease